ncbi:MAG: glycosyltransferase [Niameybacter sp.]|uniref:hypothetical protein n=1 Tax=Niameybacter sp. TaxID=2033640 RepID=UPI002FCB859E
MKVALLTMFNGLNPTYSLVTVVAEQLEMLLEHQISVKLLVSENCLNAPRFGVYLDPRIEWVPIVNHIDDAPIIWHDYSTTTLPLHDSFSQEASVIAQDFVRALLDVDLCILHDILYQGWHYIHNIALRLAEPKLPHLRFIAFTHSLPIVPPAELATCMKGRFMPMPRTLFAYPTYSGLPLLAQQYNLPEAYCRVVYNSLSPLSFLCSEVQQLHLAVPLLDADFLIVYPGRLTPSKQFEKVAALAGSIHKVTGQSVTIIFCDFNSLDIDPLTYKSQIIESGITCGLPESSIHFTSDCGFPDGFPRQGVLDLFTLSNLFICPSFSESFGLTVLEAASRGNFLILNENVPALYELGTKLHAYFMRWHARGLEHDLFEQYTPCESHYYEAHIPFILEAFKQDTALYAKTQVRLHYQPEWIWHHQLKPLLQSALRLDK